jgi:hypothetical protein
MIKLQHDRLAAFSLGVMTTVLMLAPAGKAGCWSVPSEQYYQCTQQESRMRNLESNQRRLESQQQDIERRQRSSSPWFIPLR